MDISPSIYEHAAKLIGRSPWEVSRSEDLLFEAHAAAYRCYRHAPIMVGIDIYNLEAEAYGAEVERPSGLGIPAVRRPPLASTADLARLAPFETNQAVFLRKIWDRTAIRVRVMRLVAGRENVCLGTGALPYETPPENVLRLAEYVRTHGPGERSL